MRDLHPNLIIYRLPPWFVGFLFGVTLSLFFLALAYIAMGWDSRCRAMIPGPEEALYCLPDWLGALLLGLSSGLGSLILLFVYPTSPPLIAQIITVVITGIFSALCYQLAGTNRGTKIFLSIFISIGVILSVIILFFCKNWIVHVQTSNQVVD